MMISPIIVFLITSLLATLPIVEIRGAMPIGMSTSLWGQSALDTHIAMIAALLGGVIACFVVVLVFFPLKKLLSKISFFDKIFTKFYLTANQNFDKINLKIKKEEPQKNTTRSINFATIYNNKDIHKCKKFWIVFGFCALPLPFTGVWSAGALASLLGLSFWYSVLALVLANLLSTIAVFAFCAVFSGYIDLILVIMGIVFLLVLVYNLIAFISKKLSKSNNSTFLD